VAIATISFFMTVHAGVRLKLRFQPVILAKEGSLMGFGLVDRQMAGRTASGSSGSLDDLIGCLCCSRTLHKGRMTGVTGLPPLSLSLCGQFSLETLFGQALIGIALHGMASQTGEIGILERL
jgi:hypothetical protein